MKLTLAIGFCTLTKFPFKLFLFYLKSYNTSSLILYIPSTVRPPPILPALFHFPVFPIDLESGMGACACNLSSEVAANSAVQSPLLSNKFSASVGHVDPVQRPLKKVV